MDKWFRLDALLLDSQADDGFGPHEELYQMLWQHPAIATFGMTSTTSGALQYLKTRVVNTIFVALRPLPNPVFWQELNNFLKEINEKEPNVLIVFYAKDKEHESFVARYGFNQYFFVRENWISPGEPNKIPISHDDFLKFDLWHTRKYVWDLCISYASENRTIAEATYKLLSSQQTKVFFGDHERAELWGKKLDEDLPEIFKNSSRYCLVFLSDLYLQKIYTQLELKAALERMNDRLRKDDYLLVVKLDKPTNSLLPKSTSFLEINTDSNTDDIVKWVNKKLWRDNSIRGFQYFGRDADRNK